MSSYEHVAESHRQYCNRSDAERISMIQGERWFELPQASAALGQLEKILAYPTRSRMPCLLLYGAFNMGKTSIVEKFAARHPAKLDLRAGVEQVPVLLVQMPPEPDRDEFYSSLVHRLNFSNHRQYCGKELGRVALALLRENGVKVLVLDEIDKMLAGTPRQQRVFLNIVRYLTNELRIPIVCSGGESAQLAIRTDGTLAERFSEFELTVWRVGYNLKQLLFSIGLFLPLRRPSELTSMAVQEKVIELTRGVTGRIFRLVEAAAVAAVESGEERITLASFDSASLVLPLVSMQAAAQDAAGTNQPLAA